VRDFIRVLRLAEDHGFGLEIGDAILRKLLQVAMQQVLVLRRESSSDSYSFAEGNRIAHELEIVIPVKTSPLDASVLATIPTAFRCTSPHAGRAARVEAIRISRGTAVRVRASLGMLN
jgi:hypothetical protein